MTGPPTENDKPGERRVKESRQQEQHRNGSAFEQANLRIRRRVQAGFAFALACVAAIGGMSYLSLQRLTESEAWVRHTDDVIERLDLLVSTTINAETAQRGYVITGDESYLKPYGRWLQEFQADYQSLRALMADNPEQRRKLAILEPLFRQRFASLRKICELRRSEGFEAAQKEVMGGDTRQVGEVIEGLIEQMKSREQALLTARERRAQRSTRMTEAAISSGGLLAAALVALALAALRRELVSRYRAERELRAAKGELELRVRQRTGELEQVNKSLRDNERRLVAYINATSDVIYRMAPDWSEMRQLQGKEFLADTAEPTRDWLGKYIFPDDQERVMQAIREAIRTKRIFQLEHRVQRADGTVGWTSSRAIPLLESNGEIGEWFGAARDISERKQSEDKLKGQLARLNLLNQVTRAIGERQDTQSIFQVVVRTLEEHLPVSFCCICLYDSTEKLLTMSSVGLHSAPLALELALPEQAKFRIDDNGLSRCLRGELICEPDLREVPHPFAERLAGVGLRAMIAAPLAVESTVFGALIVARLEPNSFSSGDCEFLRQVSEHVALASHQAQLNQALQRAYDDLRQTQQAILNQERLLALGQMASGIAHDINNAISPIAIYTETLLERASDLSPQTREYLEIIGRSIDDVAQTVERMREFSRAREPHQKLLPVDLNRLVLQVLDLTRARWSDMAQQRGIIINVRTELKPALPAILGVESELRDALTNLVFNAVDAMPSGGELYVRTRVQTPSRDDAKEASLRASVELEIQDTGVGMDEETRRRCLEPFFTTKGDRGTGLGLAMVYGALQRHDAEIDIQTAVGAGTTVRLSFPLATDPVSRDTLSEPTRMISPLRILIIDDDPLVLRSLRDLLEADGHHVTAAGGGQAGIDAVRAVSASDEMYQVVITDLGMPYVDGRKVAAVVRSAAPNTLIIMLTGWGQKLTENGDILPPVDCILSKPPRLRDLRKALALYLDLSPR